MEQFQPSGVQSIPQGSKCSFKSASQACESSQSQLQRLPSELLQVVLQCMHSSNWPAVRLVNKQFEASLAPLIKSITIRQWPSTSRTIKELSVSSSSTLQQVQHLQAVVDSQEDLQQLLHLLPQLPQVQHLTLRGLKPLSGLTALLQCPNGTKLAGRGTSSNNNSSSNSSLPISAAAEALARLTRLDLPDSSSSSSLPAGLQLPGLMSVALFSVDSIADLAGFAPNIQHLQCFSLNAAPASGSKAAPAAPGGSSSSLPGVLASCSTLAATFVASSSAKAAVACLASSVPALRCILAVPQLQPLAADADVQQCDDITMQGLQQALPGLQLVTA
jgi:hypothetical protein